jgi:uncharacterized protein (DUF1501 family)
MHLTRRATLLGLSLTATMGRVRFALADAPGDKRFVVVLQRGALDGMSAVVPYGDANLVQLRPALIPPAPGQPGGMFDLGGFYGLSPNYPNMAAMYQAGELLPIHAVAGPYRTRSHFEAQDLLQLGTDESSITSGWLNRVLAELPNPSTSPLGLNVGLGTPLLLQGAAHITSYAPEHFGEPSPDLMARIAALNAQDPLLSQAIAEGMQAASFDKSVIGSTPAAASAAAAAPMGPAGGSDMSASSGSAMAGGAIMSDDRARVPGDLPKVPGGFPQLATQAGQLLAAAGGPRIAVFQLEGWDTHGNQVNGLKRPMTSLDAGMQNLKTALGPAWAQTCVLIITEFGRTAQMNGTKGTDHGTAAAAFALGGAVKGGRVAVTWPGLSPSQLYQNRDLAPTLDIRAVAKGALAQHLGLSHAALARVFPASGDASPLGGIIRTA